MPLSPELLVQNAVPLSILGGVWLISTVVMAYLTAKRKSSPILFVAWIVSALSAVGLVSYAHFTLLFPVLPIVYIVGMVQIGKRCEGTVAEAMIEARLRMVETEFESVDVDPKDFPWLDLDWYDAMTRRLESLGFQRIADREAVYLHNINPAIRYYMRIFFDSEHKIWASVFNLRFLQPANRAERKFDPHLYVCGSELDDETNVITSNQLGFSLPRDIPNFVNHDFPVETSFEEVLARHREFVEQACQERKVGVTVIESAETLREKGRRDHKRIQQEMVRNGLFNRDELQRFAETNGHKEHFLKHSLSKKIFDLSEAKTKELQHRSRAR